MLGDQGTCVLVRVCIENSYEVIHGKLNHDRRRRMNEVKNDNETPWPKRQVSMISGPYQYMTVIS